MPRISINLNDKELDLIRKKAASERRSVANWMALTIENMLKNAYPPQTTPPLLPGDLDSDVPEFIRRAKTQ